MADADDLKDRFEQLIVAINNRDHAARSSFFHDQVVAFPPFSPFATTSKADGATFAKANLGAAFVEASVFAPIHPQYRVIGDTGICWGHAAATQKPKDGPARTSFLRYTFVFVKADGVWMETCVHMSELPRPV